MKKPKPPQHNTFSAMVDATLLKCMLSAYSVGSEERGRQAADIDMQILQMCSRAQNAVTVLVDAAAAALHALQTRADVTRKVAQQRLFELRKNDMADTLDGEHVLLRALAAMLRRNVADAVPPAKMLLRSKYAAAQYPLRVCGTGAGAARAVRAAIRVILTCDASACHVLALEDAYDSDETHLRYSARLAFLDRDGTVAEWISEDMVTVEGGLMLTCACTGKHGVFQFTATWKRYRRLVPFCLKLLFERDLPSIRVNGHKVCTINWSQQQFAAEKLPDLKAEAERERKAAHALKLAWKQERRRK